MRVTVLGSSASYAGPGQACAGHLVEAGGARILLDCGSGVIANLGRICDPLTLDAVFITHGHPDHFADVYALQALLRYAPEGPAPALPLHVPPGLFGKMQCALSERGAEELAAAFVVRELAEEAPVDVGAAQVVPYRVDHVGDTFALRVDADGASACYSADTRAGECLARAAAGCDLLLAEATLPEEYAGRAAHMTAREAGALAREAGVRTLALVHVWPTNDREAMARQASEAFGAPVRVAGEFDRFEAKGTERAEEDA